MRSTIFNPVSLILKVTALLMQALALETPSKKCDVNNFSNCFGKGQVLWNVCYTRFSMV